MIYEYKSFEDTIYEINGEYCEYLYDIFENWSENPYEMASDFGIEYIDEIMDIFISNYLYMCDEEIDLVIGFSEFIKGSDFNVIDELRLCDKYNAVFNKYFENYKLPELDLTDARQVLFKEVLEQEPDNPYYVQLRRALTYCVLNDISEYDSFRIISNILVDYDFKFKLPLEVEAIRKENYRIDHDIPDLTNVKKGDTWSGGRRVVNFIRALKLKPKDGTHSRNAQLKSIARSCEWEDDKESKVLTLTKIKPHREEQKKSTRKRTYEQYFYNVLLYHLNRLGGEYVTTKGSFYKNTYVLPMTYKNISYSKYIDVLDIPENKINELKINHKKFHEIVDKRIKDLLKVNLKYLEEKGLIHTKEHLVINIGDRNINLEDVNEIGISVAEAEERLFKAKSHAIEQLQLKYGTENIIDISDIMKGYKYPEYKAFYDAYIKKNFGWSYTYEEIVIYKTEQSAGDEINYTDYVKAKSALNELIVNAVKVTIQKKNINLINKYNEEERKNQERINEDDEIRELIELGIIDEDGVIKNEQYIFPESFVEQTEAFIDYEMRL